MQTIIHDFMVNVFDVRPDIAEFPVENSDLPMDELLEIADERITKGSRLTDNGE